MQIPCQCVVMKEGMSVYVASDAFKWDDDDGLERALVTLCMGVKDWAGRGLYVLKFDSVGEPTIDEVTHEEIDMLITSAKEGKW